MLHPVTLVCPVGVREPEGVSAVLLQALRAGLGWGQDQFQLLLQESPGGEDVGLEEVRYRWMLYKSKLKDVGDLRARAKVSADL